MPQFHYKLSDQNIYPFFISPLHGTWPVHVIILVLMTLIVIIFWKAHIMEGFVMQLSTASLRPVMSAA
jgi:hypothetical protein